MTRFIRSAALAAVLAGVLVAAGAAAPTDPPFPTRIDFPAPTINQTTGAVTTNFSPEGIAIAPGTTTFYCPNTTTGGILKGDLVTGVYDANWIPASPASPSPAHRTALGDQVDTHNRVWMAGNLGGTTTKGTLFVFDATTGTELAAYKMTDAASKTMNDMVVTDTAVWVADTSAPSGAGSEVQHKLTLGPGGSLPPGGEINPDGTPNPSVPAPVIDVPTPGFTGADGIDMLPNGNILFNSINGASSGSMISVNPTTLAVTPISVTTPNEPGRPADLPALLSGDGVTLDGNMLYTPENRADTATCPAPHADLLCPGDWAAVRFIPPNYTSAEVVGRLNSPAGSGLPPIRSPANMESTGNRIYGITREVVANPVTGAVNVTKTFIEQLPKLNPRAVGMRVVSNKQELFSGEVAAVLDPIQAYTAYTATINWGDGSPVTTGTVTPSGNQRLSVSGSHTYDAAGTVTVTTTINGPGLASPTVVTNQATAVVPNAGPPPPPPLTTLNPTPTPVAATPPPPPPPTTVVSTVAQQLVKLTIKVTGKGTVSRSPAGASYKASRVAATSTTTIFVNYKLGASVKLTAKPGANSKLGAWTGCKSHSGNTCQTGALSGDKTIKVSFKAK